MPPGYRVKRETALGRGGDWGEPQMTATRGATCCSEPGQGRRRPLFLQLGLQAKWARLILYLGLDYSPFLVI